MTISQSPAAASAGMKRPPPIFVGITGGTTKRGISGEPALLNFTVVLLAKLEPVMLTGTNSPCAPLVGSMLAKVGGVFPMA